MYKVTIKLNSASDEELRRYCSIIDDGRVRGVGRDGNTAIIFVRQTEPINRVELSNIVNGFIIINVSELF